MREAVIIKSKALIVDNEIETLKALEDTLVEMGIEVVCCSSAEEALAVVCSDQEFNYIISDFNMRDTNGIQLYNKINHLISANFILITNRYNLNEPEFMPFFAADNTFI